MPPEPAPAGARSIEIDAEHPWPGLAAYDETASAFFHGRDEEATQLQLLIRLAPLTALYGKSGLGKSSLLQAGLFPRLRADHALPVYVRLDFSARAAEGPMEQIARRLAEEVARYGAECPPRKPGESLWEYLHRDEVEIWSGDNYLLTPVFVFDQFEELFSHCLGDDERRRSLVDELTDFFENRIPAHLADADAKDRRSHLNLLLQRYRSVLSFREDYLADMKTLEPKVPSLLRNYLRLEGMTRERAIEVVERAGTEVVAPGVAPMMVAFVEGRAETRSDDAAPPPVVEPVLLSLFCYQLNRRRGAGKIDAELIRSAGQDILDGFYRDALADADVAGPPPVSTFIEQSLVQGDRYRGSYPRAGAVDGGLISEKQLEALTNRQRLLRVVQYADTARIELIHDCLVPVVCKTRDQRLVRERQEELRHRQAELEREVRAKEAHNRQLILWRRGLGVALAFAVIALGGMIWALLYAGSKERQATLAAQRALAFAAIGGSYQGMARGSEVGTLLALQAMALARSSGDAKALERAEGALRRLLNQRMIFERKLDGRTRAVDFSPDGRILAVGDGTGVRLIDAESGAETAIPVIQTGSQVRRVLFAPDGLRLFVGGADGRIGVWDATTGAEVKLAQPMRHDKPVSALALNAAGVLASASLTDGDIRLWQADTGRLLVAVPHGNTPRRWVSGLAFDASGTRLAASEVNVGATAIWDVSGAATGDARKLRLRATLPNRRPNGRGSMTPMLTNTLAFSPDGTLATGDRYNAVNLWSDSGKHVRSFLGHSDQVRKVAFSRDGSRLASAAADGTVNVWDVASGRALLPLSAQSRAIEDLALSPDGTRLVTVAQDRRIRLWNVATHGDAVFAVAFSPDGTRLATGGGDGTIKIWNPVTRRLVADLPGAGASAGHEDRVVSLAFSPDGQSLASAGFDRTTRIWNLAAGAEAIAPLRYARNGAGEDKFYRVVYSRNGDWLATAGANARAVLWNARTGEPVFDGRHDGQVSAVTFVRGDTQLASVGRDGTLRLWDVPSGNAAAAIDIAGSPALLDIDYDPAGNRVVMTTGVGKVLLLSLDTQAIRYLEPRRRDATAYRAKFAGDGRQLVLLGPQAEVEIRDIDAPEPGSSRVLAMHFGTVNDVAVAAGPQGTLIATASQDGSFGVSPFENRELETVACDRLRRRTLSVDECQRFLGTSTCPEPPPCHP